MILIGECDRYASGTDKNRESRFYFTPKKTSIRVYVNYGEHLHREPSPTDDKKKNKQQQHHHSEIKPIEMHNEDSIYKDDKKRTTKASKLFEEKKKTHASKLYDYHEKMQIHTHNNEKPLPNLSTLSGRKLSPNTLRNRLKLSDKFLEEAKDLIYSHDTLSLVPVGFQSAATYVRPMTFAEMAVIPFMDESSNAVSKLESSMAKGSDASVTSIDKKDKKGRKKILSPVLTPSFE